MPNELLQSSNQQSDEGGDKIVLHGEIMDGEIMDPAEDYLRRYAEDPDEAESYLETIIDNSMARTAIRMSAVVIKAALVRFEGSGEVDREKIRKYVESYKATFKRALEKQSDI